MWLYPFMNFWSIYNRRNDTERKDVVSGRAEMPSLAYHSTIKQKKVIDLWTLK
jgi:hypothetical protein